MPSRKAAKILSSCRGLTPESNENPSQSNFLREKTSNAIAANLISNTIILSLTHLTQGNGATHEKQRTDT